VNKVILRVISSYAVLPSLAEAYQEFVGASTSSRHEDLSQARSLAVSRPKLSVRWSSSTRFASVCRFCVTSLWEDPECRPEELANGFDWCQHDKGDQVKTGVVDR